VALGDVVRSGAGLAQLRAQQWCADAVRWHEREVLGREYSYVVYSRWDLQWLLPFPGLALLQSNDPGAVWVPTTQSDFFANDRFAAVPREFVSAYFEGWTLLVSGKADQVFEAIAPWVGQPELTTQDSNCETFLYARLKYGGARLNGLPTLAYVACAPSGDLGNLRTLGYHSCTAFSQLFENWESPLIRSLGGTKYPREFDAIVIVDAALQAPGTNGTLKLADHILDDAWRARLNRLFEIDGAERHVPWTAELLEQGAMAAIEQEIVNYLDRRVCLDVEQVRTLNYKCRRMLSRVFALAQSRSQYLQDSLQLAQALVLAGPLNLENWLWLMLVLLHPFWGHTRGAAGAVQQAMGLNPTHKVVLLMAWLVSRPEAQAGGSLLEEALGSRNATALLWRQRARDERLLRHRRSLQRGCARAGVASAEGLEAWLAFGAYLLQSNWLTAAVGVFQCLEQEYLSDGRPEALRARAAAVCRVREFGGALRAAVEETKDWVAWGTRLDDLRIHAPTCAELADPAWLERLEAQTLTGGRDARAASVQNVVYRWSYAWRMMLATDLTS